MRVTRPTYSPSNAPWPPSSPRTGRYVAGKADVRRIGEDGMAVVIGGAGYYALPGQQRTMAVARPAELPAPSVFPVLGAAGAVLVGVVLVVLRRRYHRRLSTSEDS